MTGDEGSGTMTRSMVMAYTNAENKKNPVSLLNRYHSEVSHENRTQKSEIWHRELIRQAHKTDEGGLQQIKKKIKLRFYTSMINKKLEDAIAIQKQKNVVTEWMSKTAEQNGRSIGITTPTTKREQKNYEDLTDKSSALRRVVTGNRPKRPFQTAAHDLATLRQYPPRGPVCGHRHCHRHVPFGHRAHHLAKAANLCKECYNKMKSTTRYPSFPHCDIATPRVNICCEGCFVRCRCGNQMARRNGRILKVCERNDNDVSDCKSPGLPDREKTLAGMDEYNRKIAELTKEAQNEAAN
jgi:hypothetical protein